MTVVGSAPPSFFALEYPRSLAVFDAYADAQQVIDYLADNEFPVQNVAVVGTDLKSVERVTGRLTRGRVAVAGAVSGAWLGVFVGIAFALFSDRGQLGFIITTPPLGALFGLVWSQIGFTAVTRGGSRDFASVSQIVATKYEVLVEHHSVDRARELIAGMPPT